MLLGVLYHNGSEMTKLHGDNNDDALREAWEKLDNKVLDYVANLLRSHTFVDHAHEINSIYALVPIIVYCHDRDCNLSQTEVLKIVKWFYYSQVRRRYVGSHKSAAVRDAIMERHAHLLFLPAYSPDLNPIENFFSKLKALLKAAEERTVDALWNRIGTILEGTTQEERQNFIRHDRYA